METVFRVVFFYLVILLGIRVLGKRDFSQLSPFELVTLLMIPELVQQALMRDDFSATNALIALCTLFLLVFLTSIVAQRSKKLGALIEGQPAVLIYKGRFVPDYLHHERVSPDEIYAEMRQVGLERIEQVKWALLESNGRISFVPLAPEDKQIKARPEEVE
ncbi:MAG: DUF421 domain-containing protein [Gemmatimonadota bacterium]